MGQEAFAVRKRLASFLQFLQDAEHRRRTALLARNPVFEGLPRRALGRLLPKMFEKAYAPGDIVFHAGDPGRSLFVILDGEVEILRPVPSPGEAAPIAVFGNNTSFGELALIDDQPRSATARVSKPTHMLILYRTDFDALIDGDPKVALVLSRNLLRMLAGYARNGRLQHRMNAAPAPDER